VRLILRKGAVRECDHVVVVVFPSVHELILNCGTGTSSVDFPGPHSNNVCSGPSLRNLPRFGGKRRVAPRRDRLSGVEHSGLGQV
jgi:hypothetical protein